MTKLASRTARFQIQADWFYCPCYQQKRLKAKIIQKERLRKNSEPAGFENGVQWLVQATENVIYVRGAPAPCWLYELTTCFWLLSSSIGWMGNHLAKQWPLKFLQNSWIMSDLIFFVPLIPLPDSKGCSAEQILSPVLTDFFYKTSQNLFF